ncbi:hypothetical protein PUN28_004863 [Cardiocondyla obscurior]|uniref:Uncharacterized protein n=1 Tax=Cardiocondyla obscurior TaxID=286306 RepID=A0AAW2GCW3_9HYME
MLERWKVIYRLDIVTLLNILRDLSALCKFHNKIIGPIRLDIEICPVKPTGLPINQSAVDISIRRKLNREKQSTRPPVVPAVFRDK